MTEAPERRTHRRLPFRMRVIVRRQAGPGSQEGVTSNVSAGGLYMTVPASTQLDDNIRFQLTIPPEVTMELPLEVECAGIILRIEPVSSKIKGVAVSIQNYRFRHDEASGDLSDSRRLPAPDGPDDRGQK